MLSVGHVTWNGVMDEQGLRNMNDNWTYVPHCLHVPSWRHIHKYIYKRTWRHPNPQDWHALGNIFVTKRGMDHTGLTRVYRGAEAVTDHHLLISKPYYLLIRSTRSPEKEAIKRPNISSPQMGEQKTRVKWGNCKIKSIMRKQNWGRVAKH